MSDEFNRKELLSLLSSILDNLDDVVSPLKALISDQLESCETLKLEAVKMKLEQFDNDDKLKEPRMLCSSRTTSIA